MRVLVVHNFYRSDTPSGENRVVEDEVQSLRSAGAEVRLLSHSSDEIDGLSVARKAEVAISPLHSVRGVREVRQALDAFRPDILHLHNPYPFFSLAVVDAADARGVPVVQTVHNHRHTCMKGTYLRDGRPCTDCLGKRVPWPGVQHSCYRGSRVQSLVMAAALTRQAPVRTSIKRFLALTPEISRSLEDAGAEPGRIRLKPNAVPDPGPPTPAGRGLLYVGRLSREKGVVLLAEVWAQAPVGSLGHLDVVGDGDAASTVASLLAGRPDATMHGPMNRAGVAAAMERCGAVAVPSLWPEAMPLVLLESLAAGRGLLVSDVGGLPNLLPPGAGVVVPPSNDGWRQALAQLAVTSVQDLAGWGRAAREAYERDFSQNASTERLLEIYREVVEEAGAAG